MQSVGGKSSLKGLKAVDKSAAFSIICLTALSGHSFATRTTNNQNVAKSIEELLIEDEGDGDGGGEGYGPETGDQGEATVCSSGTEVNEWEQGSLHYVETCKIPKKFNTETQECEVDPDGSPFGCILTTTPVDEDPNAPTGGTPGGTPGSPGSSPQPDNSPPNPCNGKTISAASAANDVSNINNPSYANKLTSITATLSTTDITEKSTFFGKSAIDGSIMTTPIKSGNATTSNGNPAYPNFIPYAGVHTHINGEYTMPSAGDIYNLGYYNPLYPTYTTMYVIGAADGSRTALIVSDPQKLAAFLLDHPKSTSINAAANWSGALWNEFTDVLLSLDPTQTGGSPANLAAWQNAQAYMLDKYNTGLTMLKADASGNYKEIHFVKGKDANGNTTYTKYNCNP